MYDPGLNLLALSYRCVFSVLGCYLTARLAPRAPMAHALALGAIGTVLSTVGVIASADLNLGPRWYPIALAVTALGRAVRHGVIPGALVHHVSHSPNSNCSLAERGL